MKNWIISDIIKKELSAEKIVDKLLSIRNLKSKSHKKQFINPKSPDLYDPKEIGINEKNLFKSLNRIQRAFDKKESIVVYGDYDADGICATAVMWETLFKLGANVMPYIPHRIDEGYGLSKKGIDTIIAKYNPKLIITVDQGITGYKQVLYAKSKNIDVIVTDHHAIPSKVPDCLIVHTTTLSGAGVSWIVALMLAKSFHKEEIAMNLLDIASIGTISDMMPLIGINRSIAKFGLEKLNNTNRVGLLALIKESGLSGITLGTFEISYILAPRLNAMGRLEHAIDALRLLCTNNSLQAKDLAGRLGITNKERQQLTSETLDHAKNSVSQNLSTETKIIFITHKSYNQGVIGLVAGKLMEEFYRPAIVISEGEDFSKASARSITGFNMIEALQSCSDLLVDVGGHPMAAGFTVENKNIKKLENRLIEIAGQKIDNQMLSRNLRIDLEIPISTATVELWRALQKLQPFGISNREPVFVSRNLSISDIRTVGNGNKHLKLQLFDDIQAKHKSIRLFYEAIAFNMGSLFEKIDKQLRIDLAYTLDLNIWNGTSKLQLKVKDIKKSELII